MKPPRVCLRLVTPFRNHEMDHVALRRVVAHYRSRGLARLGVCRSTGEAASLDEAEQLAILDTVLAEAGASDDGPCRQIISGTCWAVWTGLANDRSRESWRLLLLHQTVAGRIEAPLSRTGRLQNLITSTALAEQLAIACDELESVQANAF